MESGSAGSLGPGTWPNTKSPGLEDNKQLSWRQPQWNRDQSRSAISANFPSSQQQMYGQLPSASTAQIGPGRSFYQPERHISQGWAPHPYHGQMPFYPSLLAPNIALHSPFSNQSAVHSQNMDPSKLNLSFTSDVVPDDRTTELGSRDSAFGGSSSMSYCASISSDQSHLSKFQVLVDIPSNFQDIRALERVHEVFKQANLFYALKAEPWAVNPKLGDGPARLVINYMPYLYVVYEVKANHAVTFRIHTYGRNGCAKKHRRDHAIIYTGSTPPRPLDDELGMKREALHVTPLRGLLLDPASRIDFGRRIDLDFRTPIDPKPLGIMNPDSFKLLRRFVKDSDGYWSATQGRHSGSVTIQETAVIGLE